MCWKPVDNLKKQIIIIASIFIFMYIISAIYKPFLGYANLILTSVIALATVIYMAYTKEIILETRIDRKIAYIEKQLEKLYNPTLHFLESYDIHIEKKSPESPETTILSYRGPLDKRGVISKPACDELFNHRYLFLQNCDSKKIFKIFFTNRCNSIEIKKGEQIELFHKLKSAIEKEIGFLEKELNGLVEIKTGDEPTSKLRNTSFDSNKESNVPSPSPHLSLETKST